MSRETYLKELDKYLKRLPRKDYESAVSHFREYFEDAGEENEQQVMAELGTPKEAAAEVLRNLLAESREELQQETGGRGRLLGNIKIAVLAALAAPVGLPLAGAAVLLILALVALAAASILCVFALSLTLFCVGGKLLLRGLVALPVSLPGALLLCGTGVFAAGCSILTALLAVYLTKWLSTGIVAISGRILGKRRKQV